MPLGEESGSEVLGQARSTAGILSYLGWGRLLYKWEGGCHRHSLRFLSVSLWVGVLGE